nr:tyrosine-type recombinase/integrase [Paraglaciecola sp. L3A3]
MYSPKDIDDGYGLSSLPPALIRKYGKAATNLSWQYIFPSTTRCVHPYDGYVCRHHLHQTGFRKALKKAVQEAGILKRVTSHTFRHSIIKCVHAFSPAGHPADVQI